MEIPSLSDRIKLYYKSEIESITRDINRAILEGSIRTCDKGFEYVSATLDGIDWTTNELWEYLHAMYLKGGWILEKDRSDDNQVEMCLRVFKVSPNSILAKCT